MDTADQKIHRWRLRAEELRTIAAGMKNPDVARDMIGAAHTWERMAKAAEESEGVAGDGQLKKRKRRRRGARFAIRRSEFLSGD